MRDINFVRNICIVEPGQSAHFLIKRDGSLEQLAPLSQHIRFPIYFSALAVFIACEGVTDHIRPSMSQAAALSTLCIRLCNWMGCVSVVGATKKDTVGAMGIASHCWAQFRPYPPSEKDEQIARFAIQVNNV